MTATVYAVRSKKTGCYLRSDGGVVSWHPEEENAQHWHFMTLAHVNAQFLGITDYEIVPVKEVKIGQ